MLEPLSVRMLLAMLVLLALLRRGAVVNHVFAQGGVRRLSLVGRRLTRSREEADEDADALLMPFALSLRAMRCVLILSARGIAGGAPEAEWRLRPQRHRRLQRPTRGAGRWRGIALEGHIPDGCGGLPWKQASAWLLTEATWV